MSSDEYVVDITNINSMINDGCVDNSVNLKEKAKNMYNVECLS